MPHFVKLPIKTRQPVPNFRMAVVRRTWADNDPRRLVRINPDTGEFQRTPDRTPSYWLAMTLDHWQVAQGKTRREAVDSLRGIVTVAWQHGWVRDYQGAPEEYQRLWRGRHLWTGDDHPLSGKRHRLLSRAQIRKERREKADRRQAMKARRGKREAFPLRRWDGAIR